MARGIDHFVIAVPDPVVAAQELESALGIRATSGGEHPGAGTYNRIAFIGEPYIELIGVIEAAAAERAPIGAAVVRTLDSHPAGGLAAIALVDDQLDQTVERLRSAGSSIRLPVAGSRETADGETVSWSVATFDVLAPDRPPFLIRHEAVGSEWSRDAVQRRRSFVHPSGCSVSLGLVILRVSDPALMAQAYAAELGLTSERINDDHLVDVAPHAILLSQANHSEPPVTIGLACHSVATRVADLFGVRFELGTTPDEAG